jgi:hypothetical protein
MSNFSGIVIIAIGVLVALIGIRGTQKSVFGTLFTAASPGNNTYIPPNPTAPPNSGKNTVAKNSDGSCPTGYVHNTSGTCSFLLNA